MKIGKIMIGIILAVFCIWYIKLPDYVLCADNNTTSSQYREVTLDVVVYKAQYMKVLYDEIARRHIDLNGRPNKLVIKLYHTQKGYSEGKAFRIVVFDFDQKISYLLLDSW